MKTVSLLKFVAMFIAMFALVSCEEIKDLIDIDVDGQYAIDVPISLTEAESGIAENVELSLSEDADINEYIDLLKEITINSFEVSVTSYSGSDAVFDLELKIDDKTIFSQNDVNITEIYENEQVIRIDDQATLNSVAAALLKNKKINVDCSATSKSGEVTADFNLHCVINLTITANPLQ